MTPAFRFVTSRPVGFAAALVLALALGAAAVPHPLAALVVVVVVVAAGLALVDGVAFTSVLIGLLPWVILFGERLPHLTKTAVAAAATASLFILASPRRSGPGASVVARIGCALLLAPVAISLAFEHQSADFQDAGKYVIFCALALVVVDATRRDLLAPVARVALISGTAAVSLQIVFGLLHMGAINSKYHSGEIEAFAVPNDIAMMSATLTAAVIWLPISWGRKVALVSLLTLAAVQTGVRSGVVALLVLAVSSMIAARLHPRAILLVAAVAVAVYASGADQVIANRMRISSERGEFSTFANYGNGRGAIWTSAVSHYASAPPQEWLTGTGLRSIQKFTQQDLGVALVAHTDVLEVGVELGAIGLAGLILILLAVVRRARSIIPLIVLAVFSILNSSIGYSAPLVLAMLFATVPSGFNRAAVRGGAFATGRAMHAQ